MNNHKGHHGVVRFLVPSKNGISRYNLLNFYEKTLVPCTEYLLIAHSYSFSYKSFKIKILNSDFNFNY